MRCSDVGKHCNLTFTSDEERRITFDNSQALDFPGYSLARHSFFDTTNRKSFLMTMYRLFALSQMVLALRCMPVSAVGILVCD